MEGQERLCRIVSPEIPHPSPWHMFVISMNNQLPASVEILLGRAARQQCRTDVYDFPGTIVAAWCVKNGRLAAGVGRVCGGVSGSQTHQSAISLELLALSMSV